MTNESEIVTLVGHFRNIFSYFQINRASNYLPVNFLSKRTCTDSPGHLYVVHFSENSRIGFFGGVGVIGELDG